MHIHRLLAKQFPSPARLGNGTKTNEITGNKNRIKEKIELKRNKF